MNRPPKRNYALVPKAQGKRYAAPRLAYQPRSPAGYRPKLALLGCGGISATHLAAYRASGWDVVAFCDCLESAARMRRDEFYPKAEVYTDYQRMLERKDVEVVDIALHPEPRLAAVEAALRAGKHVLSQKPFVLDLDQGERLVELAEKRERKLAVNQNGRWAPYVRYIDQAIRANFLGEVHSVSITLNWDHTWIRNTPFEHIHHVVLYDFAIHWFDMCSLFFTGRRALSVFATANFAAAQELKPPLLAGATIQFQGGLATVQFNAASVFGPEECIVVAGSRGTIRARGPVCGAHDLGLFTERGVAKPNLKGKWFEEGFQGTMAELLCAVAEGREPSNSARENLASLALCFAAVKSADTGRPQVPGRVRRLPVLAGEIEDGR